MLKITKTSSFFAKLVMKVQKRPLTYQEICDLVEQQDAEELSEDKLWTLMKILGHNGKLKPHEKKWKGSQFTSFCMLPLSVAIPCI